MGKRQAIQSFLEHFAPNQADQYLNQAVSGMLPSRESCKYGQEWQDFFLISYIYIYIYFFYFYFFIFFIYLFIYF
jgi:hypothetical protein